MKSRASILTPVGGVDPCSSMLESTDFNAIWTEAGSAPKDILL